MAARGANPTRPLSRLEEPNPRRKRHAGGSKNVGAVLGCSTSLRKHRYLRGSPHPSRAPPSQHLDQGSVHNHQGRQWMTRNGPRGGRRHTRRFPFTANCAMKIVPQSEHYRNAKRRQGGTSSSIGHRPQLGFDGRPKRPPLEKLADPGQVLGGRHMKIAIQADEVEGVVMLLEVL